MILLRPMLDSYPVESLQLNCLAHCFHFLCVVLNSGCPQNLNSLSLNSKQNARHPRSKLPLTDSSRKHDSSAPEVRHGSAMTTESGPIHRRYDIRAPLLLCISPASKRDSNYSTLRFRYPGPVAFGGNPRGQGKGALLSTGGANLH